VTDYTKATNFGPKDALPTGDSNKIIRGVEFDTEFDAVQTAVNSKANSASPTFTGNATIENVDITGTFEIGGTEVTATATELNYVDGATSSIQTQLDTKASSASPTFTGTVTFSDVTVEGSTTFSETVNFTGTTQVNGTDVDFTNNVNESSSPPVKYRYWFFEFTGTTGATGGPQVALSQLRLFTKGAGNINGQSWVKGAQIDVEAESSSVTLDDLSSGGSSSALFDESSFTIVSGFSDLPATEHVGTIIVDFGENPQRITGFEFDYATNDPIKELKVLVSNDVSSVGGLGTLKQISHYTAVGTFVLFEIMDGDSSPHFPIIENDLFTKVSVDGGAFTNLHTSDTVANPDGTDYPKDTVGGLPTGATPAVKAINGTIQITTLTEDITLSDELVSGESVTFVVANPDDYDITWPGGTRFVGGVSPTLDTTDDNIITLLKVGPILYVNYVGSASEEGVPE